MRAILFLAVALAGAAMAVAAPSERMPLAMVEAEADAEADAEVEMDVEMEVDESAGDAVEAEVAADDGLDVEVDAEDDAEAEAEEEAEITADSASEADAQAAAEAEAEMAAVPMGKAYAEATIATPLQPARAWYGHGGFMGFGGALVHNAQWMQIMHDLLPDVAAAIVAKPDVLSTIKALENNPVCAAFGYEYFGLKHHAILQQPFEWDSFFHPQASEANPMVEQTLVAHGTPLSLFKEGTWKENSYGAVERTPETELGGVTAVRWRDLFVTAIRRARGVASTAPVTWQEFGALFPSGRFHVILDVKTGIHLATPKFLAAVVKEWAARYVDVVGAGTFNYAQNTGLSALTGGKTAEVWFFHGLVDRGVPLIHQPQLFDVFHTDVHKLEHKTVLFNGGFLLRYQRTGVNWLGLGANTKQSSYQIDRAAVEQLRAIRKQIPSMSLGIYVQEYDIDVVALSALNALVNAETAIFDKGFAWGGRDLAYYADIAPTVTDATVGTNGQILFAQVNYL